VPPPPVDNEFYRSNDVCLSTFLAADACLKVFFTSSDDRKEVAKCRSQVQDWFRNVNQSQKRWEKVLTPRKMEENAADNDNSTTRPN